MMAGISWALLLVAPGLTRAATVIQWPDGDGACLRWPRSHVRKLGVDSGPYHQ